MIISRWVAKVVLAGELPLVAERWIHSTSGPPIVHSIILHHLSLSSLVKQPLINRSNQEPASQKKKRTGLSKMRRHQCRMVLAFMHNRRIFLIENKKKETGGIGGW